MYKKNVDLICVMATCSDNETICDQIDALNWGLQCNKHIIILDDRGALSIDKENTTILEPKGKIHHASKVGFKVNEGIAWAIQNIDFKICMVLDDDALIIRKGLEKWIFRLLENKTGILGVKDCNISNKNYSKLENKNKCLSILEKYVDVSQFEFPNEYVFYAVNFQPFQTLAILYEKGFLSPEMEIWPLPCESYQTTVTSLIGHEIQFIGQYPHWLKPPLYVMHHGSKLPLDPRLIDRNFLIHHSIKKVKNTDEWEIRKYYKKIREGKWIL